MGKLWRYGIYILFMMSPSMCVLFWKYFVLSGSKSYEIMIFELCARFRRFLSHIQYKTSYRIVKGITIPWTTAATNRRNINIVKQYWNDKNPSRSYLCLDSMYWLNNVDTHWHQDIIKRVYMIHEHKLKISRNNNIIQMTHCYIQPGIWDFSSAISPTSCFKRL